MNAHARSRRGHAHNRSRVNTETNAMGNCCCCCAGSAADPSDPAVTAHILTNQFVRYRGSVILVRYVVPRSPKAVYVLNDKIYFDCCTGCIGGYPLHNITSAEVARDVTVNIPAWSSFYLNQGVKITGSDGTVIAFLGGEGEVENFVQDLNTAMKTLQKESKLIDFNTYLA